MLKSKTVWTGIIGVVTAAGGYFTGEMETSFAIQIGLGSLMGIFLRHGIAKNGGG